MSLFDIFRYPISDIYNNEDLDTIPDPILIAWLSHWCAIMNYPVFGMKELLEKIQESNQIPCKTIWGNILAMALHNYSKSPSQETLMKDIMLKDLRQRIATYNE